MIAETDFKSPQRMNDAIIIGDLQSPECIDVLDSELICGFARNAPRVAPDKWHQIKAPFRNCLETLTSHPISNHKEGTAVFFNETELTGKIDKELVFAYRNKQYTKSVTAFVIDIDGTDTIERLKGQIVKLGLFALLYTTHSHDRKKSADGDFFRVIIPLAEPFRVSEHGGKVNDASRTWEAKYNGFCKVLGCENVDSSAAKFVQMMYLPRRVNENAEFHHYLIAGRALALDEMPESKTSRKSKHNSATNRQNNSGSYPRYETTLLSDGFDVKGWFNDVGKYADIELLLEYLGWDIRNHHAGDGIAIKCPNFLEHSDPEDENDQGCWACNTDGDQGFVITCHHHHCDGIYTWDFIKLLEDRILEGDGSFPDGFGSLSELLCDCLIFPDNIDGREINISPADYVIGATTEVSPLRSSNDVQKAFSLIKDDADAGDVEFARLFAGVELGGNKTGAVKALIGFIRSHDAFNGNDIARLKKLGSKFVKCELESNAERAKSQREKSYSASRDIAHPSMDIAAPLGDTLPEAIATLSKRWKPVSVGGKFCVAKVADLNALTQADAVLQTMSEPDFKKYHLDRRVKVGDEWMNPAEQFLQSTGRASSVQFAPPPCAVPETTLNLYVGRAVEPVQGEYGNIRSFIRDVVCAGRYELFKFVWLWMAHLVQRPGEKPGTAIVLRGQGGTGKSSFGRILERLCAPHSLTLADQEHVTGRFAGSHLGVCLLAVCTESLFAGDPKVSGKLKSLITAPTLLAEAKGLPAVQLSSFTRFYFDSNNERVVPIDGDGSERRYLVMEINDIYRNNADYFERLYREIEGDGLSALLFDLLAYDPNDDNLDWSSLRIAPDTPERRSMRWHSMRPVERALLKIFEDGELTTRSSNGVSYRYRFTDDEPIRIPTSELNEHLRASSNRYDAREGDVRLLMEGLFGIELEDHQGKSWVTSKKARGRVDCEVFADDDWNELVRQKTHFFEFPPINLLHDKLEYEYQRKAA